MPPSSALDPVAMQPRQTAHGLASALPHALVPTVFRLSFDNKQRIVRSSGTPRLPACAGPFFSRDRHLLASRSDRGPVRRAFLSILLVHLGPRRWCSQGSTDEWARASNNPIHRIQGRSA